MEDISTKKLALYVFLTGVLILIFTLAIANIIMTATLSTEYSELSEETKEMVEKTSGSSMYVKTSTYQTLAKHPVYKVEVKDLLKDDGIPANAGNGDEISEKTEKKEDMFLGYTQNEIDILALTVMAEAESEPEYGQRLVIDTVLNRVDDKRFPDNIRDVVYQKSQYTGVTGSRVNKCYVRDDFRELVIEELANRTNYEVLYFRTKHYHNFGTPLFQVGGHYFSK